MPANNYPPFSDGDTGSAIRGIINKVGSDGEISIKVVSSFANIGSEIEYFKDSSTLIYSLLEGKYYNYNGTIWIEYTDLPIKIDLDNYLLLAGGTMTGELDMNDNAIGDASHIDFNLVNGVVSAEGRLKWNAEDGTLEIGMPGGVVNLQIGEETLVRGTNDQGVQIDNGKLIRISGGSGNFPYFKLADNGSIATAGLVGFATENITDSQKGYVTNFGLVRDVNTDGMVAGSLLWLGANGDYTINVPDSPDIKVVVGTVIKSHISEGIILAHISLVPRLVGLSDVEVSAIADNDFISWDDTNSVFINKSFTDTSMPITDGLSIERQSLTLVVSGTSVFVDVEAIDGGDINYWIDGIKYALDCTTGSGSGGKARIEIPQGTSDVPIASLIYVAYSEQAGSIILLTAPLGATPNSSYAPVAIITIQDYVGVTANGTLVLQRTTESISHNGKGAVSWEREKLRALGAQYWGGIDQSLDITTNVGSEDDINFNVTGGTVFQLHRQQLDSASVFSDGVMAANVSGGGLLTNFQKLIDLNEIHEIADGTSISDGDSINLIIWGSVNYGGVNKLFVNLPNGKYTNDDAAILDNNKTAVTTIPSQFRTTGYLIAKLVLKYTSANNGTWVNLLAGSVPTWQTQSQTFSTPNYPSAYNNNADVALATLTKVGAEKVRIVFSNFNTEANYDFITIRNATDSFPTTITERRLDPLSYHGNLGAFTSAEIDGETIKVRFTSDGSVTRNGARSVEFEYLEPAVAGREIIDLRGIPTGFNLGASGGVVSGWTGIFINGDGDTVTVSNGIITNVV